MARKTRWRAGRATSRDDEPQRRVPAGEVEWAGTSRRAKVVAVLVAIAFAAITFAIVSTVWRQGAPHAPPRPPAAVEVKLVPTPVPQAPAPTR